MSHDSDEGNERQSSRSNQSMVQSLTNFTNHSRSCLREATEVVSANLRISVAGGSIRRRRHRFGVTRCWIGVLPTEPRDSIEFSVDIRPSKERNPTDQRLRFARQAIGVSGVRVDTWARRVGPGTPARLPSRDHPRIAALVSTGDDRSVDHPASVGCHSRFSSSTPACSQMVGTWV